MLEEIRYNFANLTNFNGRDGRQTFWCWVLFLMLANYAVGILISFPLMGSVMGQAVTAAQSGANEDVAAASMMRNMGGMMELVMWGSVITGLVMMALFVAAFVRRLHDSGKSGAWAILPVITQVLAFGGSIAVISNMRPIFENMPAEPDIAQIIRAANFGSLGIVGWIGYLFVIVMGVLPSDEGTNRFGDGPVLF